MCVCVFGVCMPEWTDVWVGGWMDAWMGRWISVVWIDQCVDEWVCGWVDEWLEHIVAFLALLAQYLQLTPLLLFSCSFCSPKLPESNFRHTGHSAFC